MWLKQLYFYCKPKMEIQGRNDVHGGNLLGNVFYMTLNFKYSDSNLFRIQILTDKLDASRLGLRRE